MTTLSKGDDYLQYKRESQVFEESWFLWRKENNFSGSIGQFNSTLFK